MLYTVEQLEALLDRCLKKDDVSNAPTGAAAAAQILFVQEASAAVYPEEGWTASMVDEATASASQAYKAWGEQAQEEPDLEWLSDCENGR